MRNSFKLLGIVAMFICILGVSSKVAAYEDVKIQESSEKVYVDPQGIAIDGQDLYVYLNQDWVRTNALYADAGGIYVKSEAAWPWTPFVCRKCGKGNPPHNVVCSSCGTPRPD